MMNRWRLWLAIVSLFLVGAVTGGMVTPILIRHQVIRVMRHGPPRLEGVIEKHLARDLDLTDEQRDAIRKIVHEYDPLFRNIMEESREEVRKLEDQLAVRIKEVLTPEQAAAFDKNRERIHARFKKRGDRVEKRNGDRFHGPEPGP